MYNDCINIWKYLVNFILNKKDTILFDGRNDDLPLPVEELLYKNVVFFNYVPDEAAFKRREFFPTYKDLGSWYVVTRDWCGSEWDSDHSYNDIDTAVITKEDISKYAHLLMTEEEFNE